MSLWAQGKSVRIGLVTGDAQARVSDIFRPFTNYLDRSLESSEFEMVAFASIEDLLAAGGQGRIEFAFCNGPAAVQLNARVGARPVATVLQPASGATGSPGSAWTAGSVFVQRSRTDIQQLQDARGKSVIALAPLALGGWLAALREWRRLGLNEAKDFTRLEFMFSYRGIAERVCKGGSDIGVLSNYALASVADVCPGGFRVLPPPPGVDAGAGFAASTRQYPETAFVAMATADPGLASRVVVALLSLPPESVASKSANASGFTIPQNYSSVEELMRELRIPPFEAPANRTFREEMALHVREISLGLFAFAAMLFAAWYRTHRLYRDLRVSESVRHRVFDSSPIAQGILDPQSWTLLDCNPAAAQLYGWSSREALKGKSIEAVSAALQYDGSSPMERAARIFRDSQGVRSMVLAWRQQRPGGEIWHGEIHLTAFSSNGRLLLQYTLRDVTAARELERRAELLAHALRSSRDCISIGDADDRIIYVNEAFLSTYGYTEQELLGKTVQLVDSPRNPPELRAEILPSTIQGGWTGELWNRTKSGRDIRMALSTAAVYDENKTIIATIGCARDITEYRALQEQYFQSQKMEGIGRLAGGIAHDFNNLLTVINGFCALSLQKMTGDDPARNNWVAIHEAGIRAAELTRQLLAFSKRQPASLRPRFVNDLVASAQSLLHRMVGEAVTLHIFLAPAPVDGHWPVLADESQFHQVLMNLTVNARQAMPMGGVLRISTDYVVIADGGAAMPPGEYVLISVADTGAGIPAEIQPFIFEPFFTTKGSDGTGLGLATVYAIVRQSGGHVSVDSHLGTGATFHIHLPRISSPGAIPIG